MQELKKQFDIPGVVRVEPGNGGLTKIVVSSPSAFAEIYLQGAQVTHFQPADQQPIIWMSKSSNFEPNKAIRGGVPICFPWFGPRAGDPQAPMHGFVRVRPWDIESITKSNNGTVVATLILKSDEATKKFWSADFVIRHIISIGSTLEMKLEVRNTSSQSFKFEEALHTYFGIADINKISVEGLGGVKYLDKVDSMNMKDQRDPLIKFTGETDRVYLDTQATCIIDDPIKKRKIEVAKNNSNTTVVWNPWIAKAKAMADFGDEEWREMVCVETVNSGKSAVELAAGATHAMTAKVRAWPSA
jgi:glucose-6-phosphate 1-epimerase